MAAAFYLVACVIPALDLRDKTSGELVVHPGLSCALMGPFAFLIGCPAWLANLTGLAALVLLFLRKYLAAAILSGLSLALALTTFILYAVDVPLDEGGLRVARLAYPGPGFVFWVLAFVTLAAAALWRRARER